MRAIGIDFLRTPFLENFGRLDQSAGGVDHVIHDDAVAAIDFTNDMHDFADIGSRATLVDDRQIAVQLLGQGACAHDTADVGRNHDQIFVILLTQVAQQDRGCVNIVNRDIEKALNLIGMQIHGQNTRHTDRLQHIGDHLGGNRNPARSRTTVLPRVAKIGDYGTDAFCRGALERIHHDEKFHQVFVGWRAGRLHHKNVPCPYILVDFDSDLAVRKTTHSGGTERYVQVARNLRRHTRVGVTGKNHEIRGIGSLHEWSSV